MEENFVDMYEKYNQADTLIKILCAIMNEEDSVDAYEDKDVHEMEEIWNSINARFPNNLQASYDPSYIKFAQVCLNGYSSFGIDFLKQLNKRTDGIPSICIKGLIDLYNNSYVNIANSALDNMSDEELSKFKKVMADKYGITEEELDAYMQNVNEEE